MVTIEEFDFLHISRYTIVATRNFQEYKMHF